MTRKQVGRPKLDHWIDRTDTNKHPTLFDRIVQRMDELGLSQETLGEKVRLSRNQIGNWMRGENAITEAQFNRILDALTLAE